MKLKIAFKHIYVSIHTDAKHYIQKPLIGMHIFKNNPYEFLLEIYQPIQAYNEQNAYVLNLTGSLEMYNMKHTVYNQI